MSFVSDYLPTRINSGWLLGGYTLPRLQGLISNVRPVLPICSLGTPVSELSALGDLVMPPLYHEALGGGLRERVLARIQRCFPSFYETNTDAIEIIELPEEAHEPEVVGSIMTFSVDTAVEEHGPHLPLMTDTIQSYGILAELRKSNPDLYLAPPLEYGHLTWGLPFGMSIDLTPELTSEYVQNYLNALAEWCNPKAFYVVDVHGSIVHRNAIQEGMKRSSSRPMSFRWLHEPLVAYAGDRGDQHAGGVETALVELFAPDLLDADWWPGRRSELAAQQMDMHAAVELSGDLDQFRKQVISQRLNGIVGDIDNCDRLNATEMLTEIMSVVQRDLDELRALI